MKVGSEQYIHGKNDIITQFERQRGVGEYYDRRKHGKLQPPTVLERTHEQRHINFEKKKKIIKRIGKGDFTPAITRKIIHDTR